ncbi:MAG: hypothetical protein ACI4N4_07505 [Candidatus Fimenecus sp.]
MKKFTKIMSVMLVAALIFAVASISTLAATPESISVTTMPDRTVYYVGVDDVDNDIWCDAEGIVLTVTNDDGTTKTVTSDDEDGWIDITVYDYVIGDNEAEVVYYDNETDTELTTTMTVTVKECPVESIEILSMPTKTEYDMEKDVLTRDNFTLDKLYESDKDTFDAMLDELGLTFDELKAIYEEDPELMEMLVDVVFEEYDSILLVDTTGMEIRVNYKDGTNEVLTDDDAYNTYGGAQFPIYLDQKENAVTEGANTFVINVMGFEKEFSVNVTSAGSGAGSGTGTGTGTGTGSGTGSGSGTGTGSGSTGIPGIPNTDAGVSAAALAVIALMSGCGIALIPSKKEK